MKQAKFSVTFRTKKYTEEIPTFYVKEPGAAHQAITALRRNKSSARFGLDIETYPRAIYKTYAYAGLSPHLALPRLLQVYTGDAVVVFDLLFLEESLHREFFRLLQSRKWVAHNAMFELSHLTQWGRRRGVDLALDIDCSFIMTKICFHAARATDIGLRAGLKDVVAGLFGVEILKGAQLSDWSKPNLTYEQIEYAALDAVCTAKVATEWKKGLSKFGCAEYYRLCRAAQLPIMDMQLNGVAINEERHASMCTQWGRDLYDARKVLWKMLGSERVTPHTVAQYLERTLEEDVLTMWPRTETGKLKTDAHTFSEYEFLDIVGPFSKFQKLEKLTSSFGMRLLSQLNPETGRIHPSYNICGARTGRLSCSQPNCQQMPRDLDFRRNFIPRKGWQFVVCDLSQIELRTMAELSQEKKWLRAFASGKDIHSVTASGVFNCAPEDITPEQRKLGKVLGLGLIYGLGGPKFGHYARKAGVKITDDEGKGKVKKFWESLPTLRQWKQTTTQTAAVSMESRTPTGKLRKLDPDNFYGASLNTPCQGAAAEVMLFSLVRTRQAIKDARLEARLCNCVHDETIIECPKEEVKVVKQIVEDSMRQGYLDVFPRGVTNGIADATSGRNWGDAKRR